jgi:hypothetical protein
MSAPQPSVQIHADASSSQPGNAANTPPQNIIVKRTLNVSISGSLSNLTLAGPQAAMWKPLSGKETELFCPSLDGELDPAEQTNSIRNGIVRSMTIIEQHSTFPVTMGATVSCIPPTEVTEMGDKYAYTVLPMSRISSPQTIYTCDSSMQENQAWRQQYGRWDKTNLETMGVMDVTNQPYVFVHMDHPAIGLLRHNSESIGCDVDKMPKIDKQFFKLSRQILSSCCQTLRTKILSKMVTQDMNMFSVQLSRLNAETWDDLGDGTVPLQSFAPKAKWSEEEYEKAKEHHLREFVKKPYQYIARLQIEYEIPAAAAAGA